MVNFDQIIDRTGTSTVKYGVRKAMFGRQDVIPLWVADMDFASPIAVKNALINRAQHPIYGYTHYPESVFKAIQDWFQHRHDWAFKRNAIIMCPGVVPSIHAAIMALSQPGDKVIVQPPVYPPFFSAVTETKRQLICNPLKLSDQHYTMDFEHLEQCAASGAQLLLLCSPHNPVGRVWTKQELDTLLSLAKRYQLTIISDEIHADLIYPGYQHTPLASLTDEVMVVTALSPSKTFNIAGLGLSCLVVNSRHHRTAIEQVLNQWHVSASNPFNICAFEAAYQHGESWLDELMKYLNETKTQVIAYFKQHIPNITVIDSEGTYLLWLDCRALQMNDQHLNRFFIDHAKVGMNTGISFDKDAGSGFMRMNIASPRSIIMQACELIKRAFESLAKGANN